MDISRRKLLIAATTLIVAPAIVRVENLMPVKSILPDYYLKWRYSPTVDAMICESFRLVGKRNYRQSMSCVVTEESLLGRAGKELRMQHAEEMLNTYHKHHYNNI